MDVPLAARVPARLHLEIAEIGPGRLSESADELDPADSLERGNVRIRGRRLVGGALAPVPFEFRPEGQEYGLGRRLLPLSGIDAMCREAPRDALPECPGPVLEPRRVAQQGAADEQDRVRAVLGARRLDPVELEATGGTRPRGGQLAEGGGEALADRAAGARAESETAPRVRKHRDIDSGESEEGPEHERQAHPARKPAGEARMPHEHEPVARGEGPHRVETEDGRAEQDATQPGRPHEVEMEVDRLEWRRHEGEV